jgi:imidazoleglycerol phosphate synthase glutamine amidotransferase subunit HisH
MVCDKINFQAFIIFEKKEVEDADILILISVGSSGVTINNLKKNGMIDFIYKFEDRGKHITGVCLGMQLLL